MEPYRTLETLALWADRAGVITEVSTRVALEYSAIHKADIRRLVVEFETALVRTYETLESADLAIAIVAGKAKVRVAVCRPVRLDSIDGPAQPFDRPGGGVALLLSFAGVKLLIVE